MRKYVEIRYQTPFHGDDRGSNPLGDASFTPVKKPEEFLSSR